MKEQMISFETAKIALEKGFDKGMSGYATDGKVYYYLDARKKIEYPSPTQSLLQKWLREKHEIHIVVYPMIVTACEKQGNRYGYAISIREEQLHEDDSDLGYLTYEDALEKGLYEALKLI